jgi:hypothetical protein
MHILRDKILTILLSQIHDILINFLANHNCTKIIVKDGITESYFVIEPHSNLFSKISIDVPKTKDRCPQIARSISIAKNLDFYQKNVCLEIKNIADKNIMKQILQKLRVMVISALAKLNDLILHFDSIDKLRLALSEWNLHANVLLEIVSDYVTKFKGSAFEKRLSHPKLSAVLKYLNLSVKELNAEISMMY